MRLMFSSMWYKERSHLFDHVTKKRHYHDNTISQPEPYRALNLYFWNSITFLLERFQSFPVHFHPNILILNWFPQHLNHYNLILLCYAWLRTLTIKTVYSIIKLMLETFVINLVILSISNCFVNFISNIFRTNNDCIQVAHAIANWICFQLFYRPEVRFR